jgi:hypothetical protein
MKVYLAGSITGKTYIEATAWREMAARRLSDAGFKSISPMRGKSFLERETNIKDAYEGTNTADKHAIFTRDKFDSTRSEILLLNLLGADAVSIGSVMELAWAHLSNCFCVVVMGMGNPHVHAFVKEAASVVFDNLDEAVDYIISTFGAG